MYASSSSPSVGRLVLMQLAQKFIFPVRPLEFVSSVGLFTRVTTKLERFCSKIDPQSHVIERSKKTLISVRHLLYIGQPFL